MSKDISTLVEDVYDVLENSNDHSLDKALTAGVGDAMVSHVNKALNGKTKEREQGVLYASDLGKPCVRALAYSFDPTIEREPIRGNTLIKFMYGNLIEEFLISLVKAAGHEVTWEQKRYKVELERGWQVRGRSDCGIDGHMVDVKSTTGYGFKDYVLGNGLTDTSDKFGYRQQLSFYTENEPDAIGQDYFLFMNKENGSVGLAENHAPMKSVDRAQQIADELDYASAHNELPDRHVNAVVPEGKSGNMKLGTTCSYCSFKDTCWPDLRTFLYSNKPVFLTHVERLPKVKELIK